MLMEPLHSLCIFGWLRTQEAFVGFADRQINFNILILKTNRAFTFRKTVAYSIIYEKHLQLSYCTLNSVQDP